MGGSIVAANLAAWWQSTPAIEMVWLTVGFTAQLLFSMRFLVQWLASERAKRSILPNAFWYFSLGGGLLLLAYAVYRVDPVFMLGQAMGLVIYMRNIHFLWRERRTSAVARIAPAAFRADPRDAVARQSG